jgi:hypothetical protein
LGGPDGIRGESKIINQARSYLSPFGGTDQPSDGDLTEAELIQLVKSAMGSKKKISG